MFAPRLALLALCLTATVSNAQLLADNESEFSGVQGQDNWYYLLFFYDGGVLTDGGPRFNADDTVPIDTFLPGSNLWDPSAASVGGAQNTQFLSIGARNTHTCGIGPGGQNRVIFPVRRYVVPSSGWRSVSYTVQSYSLNPSADGFHSRVMIESEEIRTHPVRDANTLVIPELITMWFDAGTRINFVDDPLGTQPHTENPRSARADGHDWYIFIYQAPCFSNAQCPYSVCTENLCCNPTSELCPDGGFWAVSGLEPPDSGTPDSGTPDAGAPDAGQPDAGAPDAGTPDAGALDAGAPDAGEVDAGGLTDAGPDDAGAPDAAITDAGLDDGNDAGTFDAGAPDASIGVADASIDADAGLPAGIDDDDETRAHFKASCGCTSTDNAVLIAALVMMLRTVTSRRRR